jgi:transposase-like protein
MHTLDKKQKFIELRANGQTLGDIAQTLQVAKTTVWRWNQEEEEHIRELQMITQEEVEKDWC